MSTTSEQIKERLGIVDVVGQYIKLEKAGSNFKTKCPFHNEKTPSFMVSPTRDTFHCFGCGEGGDIFTFVEKFEGVDFVGALRILGERAGVPVTFEKKEKRDERETLYNVLAEAEHYFENVLKKQKDVYEYLTNRGLSKKTIVDWHVGYADSEWRTLYDHLRAKGFNERDIEHAGLIKKADTGRCYDLFRDRIMFPIRDGAGRVVAFSGRVFNPEGDAPKYVNSPETSLFRKSNILYGFDCAKFAIRRANFSIVVEGQIDLLASHQAGYANTVAASGTALTGEHLVLLNRLSGNIVMAFDADSAGLASAGKSAAMALRMGMDVKVAPLPKGSDPADLVKENPEMWKRVVRESTHIIERYIDALSEEITDKRKLRLESAKAVVPFIAHISNSVDQAHFVSLVAERIAVPEISLWESVRKYVPEQGQNISKERKDIHTHEHELTRKELLAYFLMHIAERKNDAKITAWLKKTLGTESYRVHRERYDAMSERKRFTLEHSIENHEHTDSGEMKRNFEQACAEEACAEALQELKEAEARGKADAIKRSEEKYKKTAETLQKIKSMV